MKDVNDNNDPEKIRLKKDFEHYRKILKFLETDLPIGALCLPKSLENILLKDGCIRVCDLLGRDLSEIKGVGAGRHSLLTSRLDEFLSISL